jgi:nicotinate-nucleotide adenylyltransferase
MRTKRQVKIGIFGSACDPPHTGHIAVGEYAKNAIKLNRLILMPTKYPPHKDMPETSAKTRFHMARLAAKKYGWEVSDMEIRRRGKSYTADTIAALKRKYPNAELFWIIGADALLSMPYKWKFGYGILAYCRFVAAKRRGFPLDKVPAKILKKVVVLKRPARRFISSTIVREAIGRGDFETAKQFLDPEVFRFIIRNHLYV